MEREYINKKRYEKKKSSRNSTVKSVTSNVKTKNNLSNSKNNKNSANIKTRNKINNKKKYIPSKRKRVAILRIAIYLFILSIIAICLRLILKDKYSPFLPNTHEKEKENTQVINIADYGIENLSNTKSNNIILSELEQYIYPMLLTIDTNYSVKYEVLESITKISNTEYILNIDSNSGISADIIKSNIENHMINNTKYSFKTRDINNIEILNTHSIKINLKQENPSFIYNLNIPVYIDNSNIGKEYSIKGNTGLLTLDRNDNSNISFPKQINVMNVSDLSKAVDMYKEGTIDVFFSSYLNVENLLGKYEYNIKAVNSGNAVFLLGNPNSNSFNKVEIRKAIAYGINKDEIILTAANKNGISIDIPFVYNNQKYRYDIYAAENVLLSSGYIKNNGVYEKYESGEKIRLELNLIVNKDSAEKNNTALIIKRNLQNIGIKVNIHSLSGKQLEIALKNNEYDLVLADITLNENPNISIIYEHIMINNNIKRKINDLSNSNPSNVQQAINELITTISDDVAIIGIYAKPTYIIYRKDITSFNNPKFYKLFGDY